LTSFSQVADEEFSGIVKSDEIFFLYSEKSSKSLDRKPRQRGTNASKDGINGKKSLKVIKRERISKEDVKNKLDNIYLLGKHCH
jgi:hypothetical protein